MYTLLVILILIICVVLTMFVLAQASKGDGLTGGLGAPGGIGTVFGVRRASDFLVKATITLAGLFMLLSLVTNLFFLPGNGETPSAVQSAGQPIPTTTAPVQSAPAVTAPSNPPAAGAQPGTGQGSPEQAPPSAPPAAK